MLEMLEKLINEHGSSQILRERLELFSDKYSVLQEKLAHSENRVTELEALVATLRAELGFTKSELDDLRVVPEPDSEPLTPEQDKILQLIFRADQALSPEQLAGELGIEKGIVDYHIDMLTEKELLGFPNITMGSNLTGRSGRIAYPLTQHGRKYVVEVLGA